jgi:endoglucanase
MVRILTPFLSILVMLAVSAGEIIGSEPLPFLRVEGNKFVDEDGNQVILRGVSFSDPDRLEKAAHWNRRYFEAAREWNCNVVRIPIHPIWWRERGEEEYLRLIDQGVQWAAELGMYVIIDWHSIGNLHTELFFRDIYNTTKTETFRFWQTISARYAGNPTVAFYEVFNEPTRQGGRLGRMSWQQYKEIIEEIIYIIYAHDTTVIPLVGGFNWAYDLTYIIDDPIDFPGIGYVSHPYPQKAEHPWEENWEKDFGFAADTYPLFATEFGFMSDDGPGAHVPVIGDETYGEAIIDYFNKKGISWTAWVFDPEWSPQLIENWDFEPTRQGRFFKEKLRDLNN